MQIERVSVDSLVFDPVNARKHSKRNLDAIKGSLAKFGQQKPLVVDKNNVVIAGNGTLEAAKELGWAEVDIHRTVLTGAEAMAFALADNKTAELAEWDEDILKDHLAALYKDGWDIEDIGFSMDDLDIDGGTEGKTDPDDVPEVEENIHGVERGQIWQLGEHRLMCGDSTDKGDVEKLMAGENADMVFTDPPYGINLDTDYSSMVQKHGGRGKVYKKVENDDKPFDPKICLDLSDEVFLFGADYYAENLPKQGSWVVWDKRESERHSFNFSEKMFGSMFELCWSKKKHKRLIARIAWGGATGEGKDERRKGRNNALDRYHPTQKPIVLAEWFFERWGKNKNLIVDLFLGSGSTLIACEKTGRKCYGMEIDPHYCSVIIERWQQFTGRQAELVKKPIKAKG